METATEPSTITRARQVLERLRTEDIATVAADIKGGPSLNPEAAMVGTLEVLLAGVLAAYDGATT